MKLLSVSEVAAIVDADERVVRSWAGQNDVARVGPVFVFTPKDVSRIGCWFDEVDSEDEEEVEDEEDEEDGQDDETDENEDEDADEDADAEGAD